MSFTALSWRLERRAHIVAHRRAAARLALRRARRAGDGSHWRNPAILWPRSRA